MSEHSPHQRESGLRIGTFAGAPVVIEPTFLLLAAYVIGSALLREGGGALVSSLVFVAAIFIAILIHEFGHAAAAAALNIKSRRIVLTFFGGYVQFVRPPEKPWHEIAVSAAGPGANLASWILVISLLPVLEPALANDSANTLLLDGLSTFALLSLILGVFNLLPGFPLDGGHILRAALTYAVPRPTARVIAAGIGLVLAALLILFAIWQSLIWTILIAGLLGLAAWSELSAARQERQRDASDTTSNA